MARDNWGRTMSRRAWISAAETLASVHSFQPAQQTPICRAIHDMVGGPTCTIAAAHRNRSLDALDATDPKAGG